jgi:hypothetical protein
MRDVPRAPRWRAPGPRSEARKRIREKLDDHFDRLARQFSSGTEHVHIGCPIARDLHERRGRLVAAEDAFQFAVIQPDPAARGAEVNLNSTMMHSDKRIPVIWTAQRSYRVRFRRA